ncbi:MAG: acetolactate synthase small subunit [Firmicutes bacterium]|nr:acetolactate synthase small subunit [Bacillota bacterium]
MRHTLAVLTENTPGVLTRVAGLFARRGFNIESLAVGVTEHPHISRMTVVVDGDDRVIEQVTKQLHKLINVIKITDISEDQAIERELVLIKVSAEPATRSEISEIVNIFRAKIVDVAPKTLVIEATGDEDKVEAIIQLLKPFGIREVVRTGKVAMVRGSKVVKIAEEAV